MEDVSKEIIMCNYNKQGKIINIFTDRLNEKLKFKEIEEGSYIEPKMIQGKVFLIKYKDITSGTIRVDSNLKVIKVNLFPEYRIFKKGYEAIGKELIGKTLLLKD